MTPLQTLTQRIKAVLPEKDFRIWNKELSKYDGFIKINLEDVLIALKSDYYINSDGYLYSIMSENEDGGIYLEMVIPGINWKLGKSLDEQDNATIEELIKLLD
jgi:hypothetical protein